MLTFGQEVDRLMKLKGIKPDFLAKEAGLKVDFIYKLLRGDRQSISPHGLFVFCKVFEVPMDHFAPFFAPDVTVHPPPSSTLTPVELPAGPVYHYRLLGTVGASKFDKPDVYDPPRDYKSHVEYPRGCYALKVTGSSCQSAGIPNGATVMIMPSTELHERRFMVVQSEEGYMLKLCSGGQLWQFRPGDAEPSAITLDSSTRIVGYVVGGSFGEPDLDVGDLVKKPKKKGK